MIEAPLGRPPSLLVVCSLIQGGILRKVLLGSIVSYEQLRARSGLAMSLLDSVGDVVVMGEERR